MFTVNQIFTHREDALSYTNSDHIRVKYVAINGHGNDCETFLKGRKLHINNYKVENASTCNRE